MSLLSFFGWRKQNDLFYRGRLPMEKTALIIVDMIVAYLAPGQRLYCEKCRQIIPAIDQVAKFCRANGIPVIFANTTLSSPTDPIARKWGMHAVEGTSDCNVVEGIDVGVDDRVVPKTSYNAFFKTNLDEILRHLQIKRVVIAGIHTHVCVLLTSAAAADLGYEVVVLEDCITTSYEPNHQSRLRFFSTHIGKLMKSRDFEKEYAKAARQ